MFENDMRRSAGGNLRVQPKSENIANMNGATGIPPFYAGSDSGHNDACPIPQKAGECCSTVVSSISLRPLSHLMCVLYFDLGHDG